MQPLSGPPQPNDARPPAWLAQRATVVGLLAGLAYWILVHLAGVRVNGIQIAAIGVCAAIATVTLPRMSRTSPEAQKAARYDQAVAEAGSFGAYLDRTYKDLPDSVLAGMAVGGGLFALLFLLGVLALLYADKAAGALFGAVVLAAMFTILALMPARALWRRRLHRSREKDRAL